MNSNEFDLQKLCKQCHVQNIPDFLNKIEKLYNVLTETNKTMNLTRIQSCEDFLNKHVADSLLMASHFPDISTEEYAIADIGCGGGFPSLVLASAFPNLQLSPVDSTGKKIKYVNFAASELGLKNLKAVQGRACELNRKKDWQNRFDIVTARAVAKSMKLFVEVDKMIKPNGRMIFYKTPDQVKDEFDQLCKLSKKQKFSWETTDVYELPAGDGFRQFIYGGKN